MSMIGHLKRLTADEHARLERDPAMTRSLTGLAAVGKNMPDMMAALLKMQEIGRQQMAAGGDPAVARQKMLEALAQTGVRMPTMGKQSDGSLRLEKSWHVLHYVLNGTAEPEGPSPLAQALLGGREVGEDVGYGPARLLAPKQVKEIAAALAAIDNIEELAASYDAEQAESHQIYCAEHEAEEIIYWFGEIKSYYDEAAKSGDAMLLWIA